MKISRLASRGLFFSFLFFFTISTTVLSEKETAGTLCLADNGKSLAAIIIPAAADARTAEMARLLSRYIHLSTNAGIPVLNEGEQTAEEPGSISIHIGRTAYAGRLNMEVEKLNADGFLIAFPDSKNVVILGASEWGTEFGVYEFLERYLGIRWLLPGEIGEHIPVHKTLKIPVQEIRQEPAFFSRAFSGLKGEQTVWARRNRMHAGVKFHHNLGYMFDPEKYVKSNPDYFPVRDGKRFFPSVEGGAYWKIHAWQPCFNAEGLAEEAVKNITDYFSKNPGEISFSLGVNDASGHCECEKCLAASGAERNLLGMRNYSDVYYKWVNAVVEGVLKQYPDKYFGLLAYSEVFEPPSGIKLNPRVIPYITYERLKWADAEREKEGLEMTKKWGQHAGTIGWYDYIYGKPREHYIVPRVWFHKMADYYRFGYENKVRALYAEAYPAEDWREGPKLYLSLKMQWDPYIAVDTTLKEWYECAVGKSAAPYLAEYFAFWEEFWTKRIIKSAWFRSSGQYLDFSSNQYLKHLTVQDIVRCEELLKTAVSYAGDEKEKARANLFLSSFKDWKKQATAGLTEFEQFSRLEALYGLKGENLLFAVENYKNYLGLIQPTPFTDSIRLTAGMLEEKAGRKGIWMKSFNSSPWGKSAVGWLKTFVSGMEPKGMEDKVLKVRPVSTAPKIDGILDDKCWEKAAKISGFREYLTGTVVSQPTIVAAAYDSKNLYLAYLCMETFTDKLLTKITEHDGPVWRDDCVEFFVVPTVKNAASKDAFYQIIISADGTGYDAYTRDSAGWNPEYRVKTFKGDLFWTVEMAIPFSSFKSKRPSRNSSWKVNFNRHRQGKDGKTKELSGWTFTLGDNQNPERFGNMLFH